MLLEHYLLHNRKNLARFTEMLKWVEVSRTGWLFSILSNLCSSGGSRIWHYRGRGFCQRRGDKKVEKVLKVEVKVIFSAFLAILLLKLCLKVIASEASEEKMIKISVLGIKIIGPRPLGGARAGCAPLDPLVCRAT